MKKIETGIDNNGKYFSKITDVTEENKKRLLPICTNTSLQIYNVIINNNEIEKIIFELRDKYSDINNVTFKQTELNSSGYSIKLKLLEERNCRIFNCKTTNVKRSRLSQEDVADVTAGIEYFPKISKVLHSFFSSRIFSLREINNYLLQFSKEKRMGAAGFSHLDGFTKNESRIDDSIIDELFYMLKEYITIESMIEVPLANNDLIINTSIEVEELTKLKEYLKIGKSNKELITLDFFHKLIPIKVEETSIKNLKY